MMRSLCAGLIAVSLTWFALPASAQTPRGPGGVVARSPDLIPIPSRITHGVVSVRNAGAAASTPSLVTVNCHKPGQEGGCPEVPAAFVGAYTNPAYPNRLVISVPALAPGHVYNHHLTFWGAIAFPSGSYVFDYVADAGATNAESNEGNNAASYTWVKP